MIDPERPNEDKGPEPPIEIDDQSDPARELTRGQRYALRARAIANFWVGQGLEPRIANILAQEGLATKKDVLEFGDGQLLRIPGLGRKSLAAIKALLGSSGRAESAAQELRKSGWICISPQDANPPSKGE
jgi:DNA-directed RNA polymerase alpha subunit